MMDTLDFTVSEHWASFKFPWSTALDRAITRVSFTFLRLYHLLMCQSLIMIDHQSKTLSDAIMQILKSIIGEEQKNINNK